MSLLGSISYYAIERIEQLTDDEVADAISTNSILNSAIRINFVDVDFRGNRRHYVAFKGFLHQNPVKARWLIDGVEDDFRIGRSSCYVRSSDA